MLSYHYFLSLVSWLFCVMASYIATIENWCAPMVVKCTLFTTPVVSLLLGPLFNNIYYVRNIIIIRSLIQHQSCSYRTLYLSTIANTQDCISHMPKTCYCGLKSSRRICKYALRRICKYALIMLLLAYVLYIFVKRNVHKQDVVTVHFLSQSQLLGRYR